MYKQWVNKSRCLQALKSNFQENQKCPLGRYTDTRNFSVKNPLFDLTHLFLTFDYEVTLATLTWKETIKEKRNYQFVNTLYLW